MGGANVNVAIVGSRTYQNRQQVIDYVNALPEDTVVISGGARGVDTWAEYAARMRGLEVRIFPANWAKYGKQAGYLRNVQIVDAADTIVCFWDGVSPGTLHSMKIAETRGKRVIVNPEAVTP